jgi:cyanophycin synthetase
MAFRTRQEEVGRAALAAGRDLLMAMIEDRRMTWTPPWPS